MHPGFPLGQALGSSSAQLGWSPAETTRMRVPWPGRCLRLCPPFGDRVDPPHRPLPTCPRPHARDPRACTWAAFADRHPRNSLRAAAGYLLHRQAQSPGRSRRRSPIPDDCPTANHPSISRPRWNGTCNNACAVAAGSPFQKNQTPQQPSHWKARQSPKKKQLILLKPYPISDILLTNHFNCGNLTSHPLQVTSNSLHTTENRG